ncbi:MAG: hypothetical protein QXS38_01610 [Candidatus Pacearchaeota archaeon]
MQKKRGNCHIKNIAFSEIFVLLIAIFAFAFVLNEASFVIGQDTSSKGTSTAPVRYLERGFAATEKAPKDLNWDSDRQLWTSGEETYSDAKVKEKGWITSTSGVGFGGYLMQGLEYAGYAAGIIMLIGQLAGWETKQTAAVAAAVGGGIMAGHLSMEIINQAGLYQSVGAEWANVISVGFGAIVGAVILFTMYKKEKEKTVSFTCEPWQPPVGGERCEECNKNPLHPCTEYRCRSLGQACQLLNKENPGKEMCAWVNPNDVKSPIISPWLEPLSPSGLNYVSDTSIRPSERGVRIVKGQDGCLQAFTPLVFGISTNEPARCRIDFNHTTKFENMRFDFGESSDFAYNHTQRMRLPGPAYNQTGSSPILQNDGTMQLFVRCIDANGNENVDEYSIKFCVDKAPDTTAPNIEGTSIPSGNPVRYNSDKVSVAFFVNEPVECRWGIIGGQTFENLPNAMDCATEPADINAFLSYTCIANFTGIKNNAENKFYIRCKDKPGLPENERNVMTQDYVYMLKGSQPLNIVKVGPNETVSGSTEDVAVDLTVETDDGAEEGKATCMFSPLGTNDTYVLMAETNNYLHKQTLLLRTGTYTYYFRCTDLGGNTAESKVTFNVFSDREAPKVTRVYKEEGAGLKVVTNEDAECRYSLTSCNFVFGEGIALVYSNPSIKTNSYLEWKPNTVYYIKCRDMYGNEPNPNECSSIVRAVETLSAK